MTSFDINNCYSKSNNTLPLLNKREIFPPMLDISNFSKDIILFNDISKQEKILDSKEKNNIINDKNIKIPNNCNDITNHKSKNINININNNEILFNENYCNLINKNEKYDEIDERNGIFDLTNFPQFLNDQKEIKHKTQINKNAFNINDINSKSIINNFHLFNNNHSNNLNNIFLIPNPLAQFPISSFFKKRLFFNSLGNKFNNYPLDL